MRAGFFEKVEHQAACFFVPRRRSEKTPDHGSIEEALDSRLNRTLDYAWPSVWFAGAAMSIVLSLSEVRNTDPLVIPEPIHRPVSAISTWLT
jgi:hypothetical protein